MWVLLRRLNAAQPEKMVASAICQNADAWRDGTCDIAILPFTLEGAKPFMQEQLFVSVPPDHELAGQKAQLLRLERGYRTEEVEQARAAVARARAVADNAAINLNRVSAMRARNAISQKELDNARSSDRSARAELRSAQEQLDMLLSGYREEEVLAQRAAVDAAAAALELAEIRLRDALLTAPQDGIVLTRAREAGAIVQAGQTVYTLSLVDPVWLRVYVDEPQLGRIKPGMAVRVRVDAVPDKEFSGRVGFISPAAEFTPKSVETMEVRTSLVYRLRVQVDDPDNVMRQGMPVTVTLVEP